MDDILKRFMTKKTKTKCTEIELSNAFRLLDYMLSRFHFIYKDCGDRGEEMDFGYLEEKLDLIDRELTELGGFKRFKDIVISNSDKFEEHFEGGMTK